MQGERIVKKAKTLKKDIIAISTKSEWKIIPVVDKHMYSFQRGQKGKACRINIWWNKKNPTLTIGISLKCPNQGKIQKYKKGVSLDELKLYFRNPDIILKKGYGTKKDNYAKPKVTTLRKKGWKADSQLRKLKKSGHLVF